MGLYIGLIGQNLLSGLISVLRLNENSVMIKITFAVPDDPKYHVSMNV
jgi:hypothetical protein